MRGCYTTEFGRGAERGGVGAGKGGVGWHLDGLDTDRVAFMVYFWFGWNNRMGVSGAGGGGLMRCRGGNRTGQEEERGVGIRSTGKSLLASRGNHRYTTHPSLSFRLFPLIIWRSVLFLRRRRPSDHNSTASPVCPAPAPSTDFRGPSPQHGATGINTNLEAEGNGTM